MEKVLINPWIGKGSHGQPIFSQTHLGWVRIIPEKHYRQRTMNKYDQFCVFYGFLGTPMNWPPVPRILCTKVCDWPKTGWSQASWSAKNDGQGQSTSHIWRQQCSEAQLWSCANAGTCLSNHWEPIEVIRGIPCVKTICRPQPRAFLAAQTPGRDSMKKHVDVTSKIADFYRGKLRLN